MKSIVTTELQYRVGGTDGTRRANFLNPGQYLAPGDQLVSQNGLFRLSLESDGNGANLALYAWNNDEPIWATGYMGQSHTDAKATFGEDGNFVVTTIYGEVGVAWSTNLAPYKAGQLILLNNGNLVAYDQTPTMQWQACNGSMTGWGGSVAMISLPDIPPLTRNVLYGTVPDPTDPQQVMFGGDQMRVGDVLMSSNGLYCLQFTQTGQLMLVDWNNNIYWNNNVPVKNTTGAWAHMRATGEFCVCEATPTDSSGYDKNNPSSWHTKVWSSLGNGGTCYDPRQLGGELPGTYITLQDDGNLVVYGANQQVLWATNTVRQAPSPSYPMLVSTTNDGHISSVNINNGNVVAVGKSPVCGGVLHEMGHCGAVLGGLGICGAVYSGANFTGVSVSGAGACGARASLLAICGAVASGAGASVESITGTAVCGAVANVAGVCGAVLTGGSACAAVANGLGVGVFAVSASAACGAVAVISSGDGFRTSAVGACIEADGAGVCGANATEMEAFGACALQVGFCGLVACVAFPVGGNW